MANKPTQKLDDYFDDLRNNAAAIVEFCKQLDDHLDKIIALQNQKSNFAKNLMPQEAAKAQEKNENNKAISAVVKSRREIIHSLVLQLEIQPAANLVVAENIKTRKVAEERK